MNTTRTRALLGAIALGGALAAGLTHPAPAHADTPGCVSQPWLYGGLLGRWTSRIICDGPRRPDGSWTRAREFYAPAYVAPARSSCYGGYYSSSCTFYPAHVVPEFQIGPETYPVTDDTVLPDEPGYIMGAVA
jgi:hypothetical protein